MMATDSIANIEHVNVYSTFDELLSRDVDVEAATSQLNDLVIVRTWRARAEDEFTLMARLVHAHITCVQAHAAMFPSHQKQDSESGGAASERIDAYHRARCARREILQCVLAQRRSLQILWVQEVRTLPLHLDRACANQEQVSSGSGPLQSGSMCIAARILCMQFRLLMRTRCWLALPLHPAVAMSHAGSHISAACCGLHVSEMYAKQGFVAPTRALVSGGSRPKGEGLLRTDASAFVPFANHEPRSTIDTFTAAPYAASYGRDEPAEAPFVESHPAPGDHHAAASDADDRAAPGSADVDCDAAQGATAATAAPSVRTPLTRSVATPAVLAEQSDPAHAAGQVPNRHPDTGNSEIEPAEPAVPQAAQTAGSADAHDSPDAHEWDWDEAETPEASAEQAEPPPRERRAAMRVAVATQHASERKFVERVRARKAETAMQEIEAMVAARRQRRRDALRWAGSAPGAAVRGLQGAVAGFWCAVLAPPEDTKAFAAVRGLLSLN